MTYHDSRIVKIIALLCLAVSVGGCGYFEYFSAEKKIHEADLEFQNKRYFVAAVKYNRAMRLLQNENPERERLMLQVGHCYYNEQVHSLHNAQTAYRAYLKTYPEGLYTEEARYNLERLQAIIANREREKKAEQSRVLEDVAKIRAAIVKEPYDSDLYFRLGSALWNLGEYEKACDAYLKSIEINAWLREHELIKKRLMTDANGEIIPITPERLREMEYDQNPLVVFDVHEYRSRLKKDVYSANEKFLNVQGMVRNRSSRRLENVIVEIRFYNPAREMLDVKRTRVGNMLPNDMRGFSVRATNYDNLYNIAHYEVVAYEAR